MKDLSKPEQGLKLNWTVSKAGTNRNVIPADATAQADARALKVADFDELEKALQDKIKNRLLPDSKVELKFEVRRPPLEANDASRRVAAYGKTIYRGARTAAQGRREGDRRRHRRRVCRAQDQGRRGRRHGPVGLRRALQRCRICASSTASCRVST